MKKNLLWCFGFILFGMIQLEAQESLMPKDPAIREGVLDNGMRYFIRKNSRPENRAELRLAVHAGANQEDEDQKGLAHFVEHMAFNGTTNFEKSELVDFLESVGTRFGPDLNAYTSFDETVYMLQARTDTLALLEKGLLILEDWAQGVTFEDEEIDKERGVVISEWRSGLGADRRMLNEWLPIIYQGSRYAERLPIGDPQIVENADYETVRRFYRDWYRPELMAVVAVGDFDLDWMEKEIKQRFSKLKNIENGRSRTDYAIPLHEDTRVVVLTDPEASFTRVNVMYKHPAVKTKTKDDYRRDLVYRLFNRMLSARLDELTQQPEPPFTFGYFGYGGSFSPKVDEYSGSAFAGEGQAMQALKTLLVENKRVLAHGFLPSELERAKTELMRSIERAVKEKDKTESNRFASQLVSHFLNDNPVSSVEQRLELYETFLPGIKLEEITPLAAKWITDENRSVLITAPEKEGVEMPTKEEVIALFEEVNQMDVEPYEDQVSDAPLLAETLSPVEIVSENYIEHVDVTELTLANGIKVALKPTDFKNDQVEFRSFSPGGSSLYEDKDYMEASSITSILGESGLAEFNSIQLEKKLTGKRVNVSPFIGALTEGINGSSSVDDLETMFQLIYLSATAPRKDADALKSYIAKQKSFFANMMSNPQYYFYSKTSEISYGNHPRVKFPPSIEDMEAIDLDRAFEIYQERFSDLDDLVFVFVGAFEVEALKPLIATYIGNLPVSDREESWQDRNVDLVKGKVVERFEKGATQKSLIEITWHSDYDAWEAKSRLAYDFMVGVMRIKLREAMREDEGGVYGVNVRGYTSKFPKQQQEITISFNSEPDNTDHLIEVAKKEIQALIDNGPAEKEMQKVRETTIQGRIKNLKENRWWESTIFNHYYLYNGESDFKYADIDAFKALVGAVTAEEVHEAFKNYMDVENYIEIVMMPEAGEETKE